MRLVGEDTEAAAAPLIEAEGRADEVLDFREQEEEPATEGHLGTEQESDADDEGIEGYAEAPHRAPGPLAEVGRQIDVAHLEAGDGREVEVKIVDRADEEGYGHAQPREAVVPEGSAALGDGDRHPDGGEGEALVLDPLGADDGRDAEGAEGIDEEEAAPDDTRDEPGLPHDGAVALEVGAEKLVVVRCDPVGNVGLEQFPLVGRIGEVEGRGDAGDEEVDGARGRQDRRDGEHRIDDEKFSLTEAQAWLEAVEKCADAC
jgi:hypothetical protein